MASYKQQTDPDLIEDIHARKEFAQLWVPPPGDEDFRTGPRPSAPTELQSHQRFVRAFMNPSTPNSRMHLMHSTGCHARGTLIMRADGSSIRVEDVRIGDYLARPSIACSREFAFVTELHHGVDKMVVIVPHGCADDGATLRAQVVNYGHVLHIATIKDDGHYARINMPVRAFMKMLPKKRAKYMLVYNLPVHHHTTISKFMYAPFTIYDMNIGEYYGFTVATYNYDSARMACTHDGLFLASDGMVMHNSGKCLGIGTPIITARGIIPVEQVAVGDTLFGEDGSPRIIESLAQGTSECYKVAPLQSCASTDVGYFDSFVCNKAHILTVVPIVSHPSYARGMVRALEPNGRALIDVPIKKVDPRACMLVRVHACDVARYRSREHSRARDVCITCSYCPFTITSIGKRAYYGFTLKLPCNGRFLLGDGTVTHNTRAAILVAQEHVKMFRAIYRGINWRLTDIIAPSIFIVAFSGKHAFMHDLIKYADFGYATSAEYSMYMQYAQDAPSSEDARLRYKRFASIIKKRITNRANGGFYKFLGYDLLANQLFGDDVSRIGEVINEARLKHEHVSRTLERAISEGRIRVNARVMSSMTNSLIIADEIHNTYNAQSINTRGVALQYILDHAQGIKFLSLSATPINSAPSEVVDFANYFVDDSADKETRDALFSANVPIPGALEKLRDMLRGRISFLFDYDPKYFPKRIDVGEPIIVNGTELPYLRFTPCAMSQYFQDTVSKYYEERATAATAAASATPSREETDTDDSTTATVAAAVSQEEITDDIDDDVVGVTHKSYALFDMAFPNPDSDTIGLYDSSRLYSALASASTEWRAQVGINIGNVSGIRVIEGKYLRMPDLEKYSAKYARMIKLMPELIRETGPCKIMIYHERVRVSGVLLIRSVLRENGIIEEHDTPTDATLCAICGRVRADHSSHDTTPTTTTATTTTTTVVAQSHSFRPLRFVTLYSELDETTRASIYDKYKSPDNARGEWCSILLGSRMIRESYDFNAVRHLIILSLPSSISQLIQVFGRCVRRRSHALLPAEERDVRVRILVNVARDLHIEPEIRKYAVKLESYSVVQVIEREMARFAVDAGINRNAITRADHDELGLLMYDEAIRFTMPNAVRVDTFYAYGYGTQEIQFTVDIIKRLFMERSVWTEQELRTKIRAPSFGVHMNPRMISESSIDIAMAFLVTGTNNPDRAITVGTQIYYIVASRDPSGQIVLWLAPIDTIEVAGIARTRTIIDIEAFMRGTRARSLFDSLGRASGIDGEQLLVNAITEDIVDVKQISAHITFEDDIMELLRAKFANSDVHDHGAVMPMRAFLYQMSTDNQKMIARRFISSHEFRIEFSQLYEFVRSLGIFVNYSHVRDMRGRFDEDVKFADDDPVAYFDGHTAQLYSGSKWFTVERNTIDAKHGVFEENNVVIGVYKQFPYGVKFQLRDPITKIRAQKHTDARKSQRGSVCVTRARSDIEKYAVRLGIPRAKIHEAHTVHHLCTLMQEHLLRAEIEARRANQYTKFVYGWWNIIPALY